MHTIKHKCVGNCLHLCEFVATLCTASPSLFQQGVALCGLYDACRSKEMDHGGGAKAQAGATPFATPSS